MLSVADKHAHHDHIGYNDFDNKKCSPTDIHWNCEIDQVEERSHKLIAVTNETFENSIGLHNPLLQGSHRQPLSCVAV